MTAVRDLRLNGHVYTRQKGTEIEIINKFSEELKKDDKFFRGFKIISTGAVRRGDFHQIPVMTFQLTCSSEIKD